MSLPAAWVDSLFARLMVRYGTAFMRQYEGFHHDIVKGDWGDVLNGVSADAIAYALQFLPVDRPPTAMQFREQCRRAPPKPVPALEGPEAKPDPARLAACMARLSELQRQRDTMSPAEYCAKRIRAIVASRGGRISAAQQHVLRHCERLSGDTSELMGDFRGIPEGALPAGMRPQFSEPEYAREADA